MKPARMDQPTISVVLTTYNRGHLLPRAVASVINSTYPAFDLIIVDDASDDGTAEYARQLTDPRVRYLRLSENGGVLRARNRGLDACTGEYVTTLDDDDELEPDALATVVREFSRDDRSAVDVLWFDCVDAESGQMSGSMTVADGPIRFDDYLCGRIAGDFWLTFRRPAIARYRFDERFKAHESLLWLRIHRSHRAWHVPKVLCRKYRRHGGPRLSDTDVRMNDLARETMALAEFEREFGKEMAETCPTAYGGKLAYLGLHQLATGETKAGRASIRRSLRHRSSLKYLLLYCASFFLSAGSLAWLIARREA